MRCWRFFGKRIGFAGGFMGFDNHEESSWNGQFLITQFKTDIF
jgi:hypothetical protein